MGQTFQLEDVVASAMDAALRGVWTALPGVVQSYDHARQTVVVLPTVKVGDVGEDGERDVREMKPFDSVPLLVHGGGEFRTTYPVKAGDTVLLVIMSREIGHWLSQGGTAVDSGDDRHHHLSDAVAITGLRPWPSVLKNAPTDRMSIGSDTGATVEIHSAEIRLGSDAADAPVMTVTDGSDFRDALDAAIATAPTTGVQALTALKTALAALPVIGTHAGQKWPVGSPTVKADD